MSNFGFMTIDIDFVGDLNAITTAREEYGVDISCWSNSTTAYATGTKFDLINYMLSDEYGMDREDLEVVFPELM